MKITKVNELSKTGQKKRRFTPEEIQFFIDEADRYNLEGRSILHSYSIRTIQNEFNGIGPDRMNKVYRWILTHLGWRYLSATMIHDMDYVKGGTEEDFHKSNLRLRTNLRKILKTLFSKWNPWYWVEYVSINIIHRACEYYGWDGFHKNTKRQENKN